MKIKRILTLLLIAVMLASIFSGCIRLPSKRRTVTEEEWNNAISGNFDNYTCVKKSNSVDGNYAFYLSVDGKQWIDKRVKNGDIYAKYGQFLIDGKYVYCMYDLESKKWAVIGENKEIGYPLQGMPYSLSDFKYDEKMGAYVHCLADENPNFTDEQILNGDADAYIIFEEGKCVYSSNPFPHKLGLMITTIEITDYGTTKVDVPDLSDIIFENN